MVECVCVCVCNTCQNQRSLGRLYEKRETLHEKHDNNTYTHTHTHVYCLGVRALVANKSKICFSVLFRLRSKVASFPARRPPVVRSRCILLFPEYYSYSLLPTPSRVFERDLIVLSQRRVAKRDVPNGAVEIFAKPRDNIIISDTKFLFAKNTQSNACVSVLVIVFETGRENSVKLFFQTEMTYRQTKTRHGIVSVKSLSIVKHTRNNNAHLECTAAFAASAAV